MQVTKAFGLPDLDYAVPHACLLAGSQTNSNEKAGNDSLVVVVRSQGNARGNGSPIKYVCESKFLREGFVCGPMHREEISSVGFS